jgi:hypothetical protein
MMFGNEAQRYPCNYRDEHYKNDFQRPIAMIRRKT